MDCSIPVDLVDARAGIEAGTSPAAMRLEACAEAAGGLACANAFLRTRFDTARAVAVRADRLVAQGRDAGRPRRASLSRSRTSSTSRAKSLAPGRSSWPMRLRPSPMPRQSPACGAPAPRSSAAPTCRSSRSPVSASILTTERPRTQRPSRSTRRHASPAAPARAGRRASLPAPPGPRSAPTQAARSAFRRHCRDWWASRAPRGSCPRDGAVPLSTTLDTVVGDDALRARCGPAARDPRRENGAGDASRVERSAIRRADDSDDRRPGTPSSPASFSRALSRIAAAGARIEDVDLSPLADAAAINAGGGFLCGGKLGLAPPPAGRPWCFLRPARRHQDPARRKHVCGRLHRPRRSAARLDRAHGSGHGAVRRHAVSDRADRPSAPGAARRRRCCLLRRQRRPAAQSVAGQPARRLRPIDAVSRRGRAAGRPHAVGSGLARRRAPGRGACRRGGTHDRPPTLAPPPRPDAEDARRGDRGRRHRRDHRLRARCRRPRGHRLRAARHGRRRIEFRPCRSRCARLRGAVGCTGHAHQGPDASLQPTCTGPLRRPARHGDARMALALVARLQAADLSRQPCPHAPARAVQSRAAARVDAAAASRFRTRPGRPRPCFARRAIWPWPSRGCARWPSSASAPQLLDADGCRLVEPGLNPQTALHAGIYSKDDDVGNCREFTHLLRKEAARNGVRFRFYAQVERIAAGRTPTLTIVRTPEGADDSVGARTRAGASDWPSSEPGDDGVVEKAFDAVVVCAALGSQHLLRPLGIRLPLQPVYGYSVTAPLRHDEQHLHLEPRAALMDEHYKVAISRLGKPRARGRQRRDRWPVAAFRRRRADHARQDPRRLVPRSDPAPRRATVEGGAADASRRPASPGRERRRRRLAQPRARWQRLGAGLRLGAPGRRCGVAAEHADRDRRPRHRAPAMTMRSIRRLGSNVGREPMFSIASTRSIEAAAMAGLPAHALMARAGAAVATLAMALAPHAREVLVWAGPGNNGGDGLDAAVHLRAMRCDVTVALCADASSLPADAADALAQRPGDVGGPRSSPPRRRPTPTGRTPAIGDRRVARESAPTRAPRGVRLPRRSTPSQRASKACARVLAVDRAVRA